MRRRDISAALLGTATVTTLLPSSARAQTCTAPCYPITPAESAAGVSVTNQSAFVRLGCDVRRYGADNSGATDCSSAIAAAQLVNTQIYFPPGTYRISTSLTFIRAVALVFDAGAKLSLDAGIAVQILGQVVAGSYQIFSGSGRISTAASYTNGPGRWDVKWWGARGDGSTDDTAVINAALAAVTQGTIYFPGGDYYLAAASGGLVVPTTGGSPSLQGEGQFTVLHGHGFASSNALLSINGTAANVKTCFCIRDMAFVSDNQGAAALFLQYCNTSDFSNLFLGSGAGGTVGLATGIVCGTNVYNNTWKLWHLGGVAGRFFIVENGGFNNNNFLGGRFGGQGFWMAHSSGSCGGNNFYGVDWEGISNTNTGALYVAPTGSGTVRAIGIYGGYAENNDTQLFYFNSPAAGAIRGVTIQGGYFEGGAVASGHTHAGSAFVFENCTGIYIHGNDVDDFTNWVINDAGGNSAWDVGPNDYTAVGAFANTAVATVVSGSTIATSTALPGNQSPVTSSSAVTGAILQAGTGEGQICTVVNTGSSSITMAAASTSRVANGTGCVIAANSQKSFTWRVGTSRWYSA